MNHSLTHDQRIGPVTLLPADDQQQED